MIKDFGNVYKLVFEHDKFIKSFMDIFFKKDYEKEIAQNTSKLLEIMTEK